MEQTGKATVRELGIRPNETITIRFTLADGSNNNIIATNIKASSSTGRQKRASAMAATASFKDVIAAQDAIMKNKKKKSRKRKTTSTTGNISGFSNVAAAASKKSKQPKKVKMEGSGYRLDGKSFAGSSPSKKKTLKINRVEDIASTQALAKMRSSLHQMEKETRGLERLSAANARKCVFDKVEGGSLENGGTVLGTANDDESISTPDNCLGKTLYTIKYPREVEGRGGLRQDKVVNIYEEELVRVALVNLHFELFLHSNGTGDEDEVQRAGLTPVMIAQSCPDVFWSLVFLYYKKTDLTVDDMLLTILPQLDWSHLERGGRKRVLSEKARENKRQAKSTTTSDDATQNNGNPEAMAIADLFNSIEDDWNLVTPDEDDIDELIECIMEGSGEGYDDDTAKAWATILVDSVQNWRVLANSDAECIKSLLSKKDCPTTTVEIIQGWIYAARERALGEIMLEILDGDQDALDVLREAKADNPMDLASFGNEQTLLVQHAKFYHVQWELTKVIKWIVRAEMALDNCAWLKEWTYDNKEHDEGDNVDREKERERRVARLSGL